VAIFDRIKHFGFYEWFILIAEIVVIPLDLFLFSHSQNSADLKQEADLKDTVSQLFNSVYHDPRSDLQNFIVGTVMGATTVSTASYLGRCADYSRTSQNEEIKEEIKQELNKWKNRNRATFIGLWLGLVLGIVMSAVFFLPALGFTLEAVLTLLMGTVGLMSACGGLSSRLGQTVDRFSGETQPEQNRLTKLLTGFSRFRNYELSIIFSLVLSIIPITFLLLSAPLVSVLQILTFITTAIVLASSLNSGAHYLGRVVDFFTNEKTLISAIKSLFVKGSSPQPSKFWERCKNEELAVAVGLGLGILAGIVIVCLGLWAPPFLLALPLVLKAPLIVIAIASAGSRLAMGIGRSFDKLWLDNENKPRTLLHVWFKKGAQNEPKMCAGLESPLPSLEKTVPVQEIDNKREEQHVFQLFTTPPKADDQLSTGVGLRREGGGCNIR
jgi:hypothetical protein